MKTLPAGMQADMESGVTTLALCWKLTLRNGTIKGFTDHDRDLTFDSITYKAETGLNASAVSSSINMSVGDLDTIGALNSEEITEADIRKKIYDNAMIELYRVDWTDVVKRDLMFTGYLGSITRDQYSFKAEVRSISSVLNQPKGRVYQKTCSVDLFSTGCGVDLSTSPTYQYDNIDVGEVFSSRVFTTTDADILARPEVWFNGGLLIWRTGDNAGQESEIKAFSLVADNSAAWVELWEPMAFPIQATDTFYIRVGCDKSIETCQNKFANQLNFRGFPRMPGTDNTVTYTTQENRNDGSSWYK